MNIYSESNSDNESFDSWNETDDDDEENDYIYEPEEPSLHKFTIVLCEKYSKRIHGLAPKIINNHYLTHTRYKQLNMNLINVFRNRSSNLNLEIAECIYLQSNYCISIIKTFWLKIVQRKWKKIFKERKQCINRRYNLNSLKYKEMYGVWPNNCSKFPRLRGMLYSLSRSSMS